MELENTSQVTNYKHIPANQRSIQFTPSSTATTFQQAERLVRPNTDSDHESMEKELETFEKGCHVRTKQIITRKEKKALTGVVEGVGVVLETVVVSVQVVRRKAKKIYRRRQAFTKSIY